jgi:hypothetical protein
MYVPSTVWGFPTPQGDSSPKASVAFLLPGYVFGADLTDGAMVGAPGLSHQLPRGGEGLLPGPFLAILRGCSEASGKTDTWSTCVGQSSWSSEGPSATFDVRLSFVPKTLATFFKVASKYYSITSPLCYAAH